MMPYETYVNLIQQLDDLVAIFEHHPDPTTREQVTALLSGVDLLHREGLRRLVESLREAGGDELLERAAADPVVEILLGLYDLVELDLPEEPQPQATSSAMFIPLEDITIPKERDGSN
ncbi:MAG: hypothetical protein M3220_14985 [Chloroflexota bacterium]|nr:hypothetical protein [Chloroflexota bacterium]